MSSGEVINIRRGQRIVNVFQGPWEPFKGSKIPGIAGATWWYSSAYLELESGESYKLTQGSLEPAPVPEDAKRAPDLEGALPAVVEDVVRNTEGNILILLSGGRYLENANLPGGSRLLLTDFAEWSPEDLEEERVSVLDGRTVLLKPSST